MIFSTPLPVWKTAGKHRCYCHGGSCLSATNQLLQGGRAGRDEELGARGELCRVRRGRGRSQERERKPGLA